MRFHRCLFVLLALLVIGLHAAEVALEEFPSCAVGRTPKKPLFLLLADCSWLDYLQ